MKWVAFVICCAVTGSAAAAFAQDTRNAELATANRRLNETFGTIVGRLRPSDQAALRKAHRAWIAFRDADCAFGDEDHRDCLIARTEERENQMRDTTYFDSSGRVFILPRRKP